MEERYNTLNGMHPLISYMLGVHAEYTCSKELLEQVSEMVHKYKAPLFPIYLRQKQKRMNVWSVTG